MFKVAKKPHGRVQKFFNGGLVFINWGLYGN